MSERRVWQIGWVAVTCACLLLSGNATAAESAPPPSGGAAASGLSREEVNPAQQAAPVRRPRQADVFTGPAKEACQLSDDPALAFEFHQGIIDDPARILSDHDRQSALSSVLGRRITPHQLCDIRDRLAATIFRRGVLARVVIPPQTIASGVVKFRVIAAKIVSVRFDGDDIGPAQAKVEAYLNHLRRRDAFQLDEAQHWLLLVNDIPGVQATAKIVHSTAPGAPPEGLDLVVTVRREAVDEYGQIANTNAKTLGPWTGVARIDLNSFTGLGEHTSIVLDSTLGNNRQEVVQLIESAKLGDSGLFAQASFSYGHSRPGGVLEALDLTGNSYVGTIELDYPLIRLQRESLTLATGMDIVNQTTAYPSGQGPLADDALRVVWVRSDASVLATDRPFMGDLLSTEADISVQGRKGLEVLGATAQGLTDVSRPGGRADAWVVRAEGHASARLAPVDVPFLPITFSTHFIGQWADRPLLSYEQQAIGNLSIGRGYDPNAAAGDRVVAGEFKIEVGPLALSRGFIVTPYIFEDVARVGYLLGTDPDVTLRSIGGGFEFRIPYDRRGNAVRIDAGFAKPLDKPVAAAAGKPPPQYLVQIIVAH